LKGSKGVFFGIVNFRKCSGVGSDVTGEHTYEKGVVNGKIGKKKFLEDIFE